MNNFTDESILSRRQFLKSSLIAGATIGLSPWTPLLDKLNASTQRTMKTRTIPSSGEELPVVGLGTWQQFDVESDPAYLKPLRHVLSNLFRQGGSVIDSSPMYGRAERVVGELLEGMDSHRQAFLATKVWTQGRENGINQMKQSMNKLNASTIDLLQVHNLVDWRTHLETLREWKQQNRIRYTGVTHYTESAFDELETIMSQRKIDFVQLPYSLGFRQADQRLLPLARDQEIAVLVNRPFEAGSLFRTVRNTSLPEWADEIDCSSWAQYFLKFILGHPAVTCVIPGTSNPRHMLDNAGAGFGRLPDSNQRDRMLQYWDSV